MIDQGATIAARSRLVPASRARADADFPILVLALAHGDVSVTVHGGVEGQTVVFCESRRYGIRTAMVSQDFDIVRDVSKYFRPALSPFLSEPFQDIVARARAMIRVRFSSRGAF